MPKVRNYRKERLNESPKRKEDRKARGRARTAKNLKDGDPREVDHKRPLSEGGSNERKNLKVVSRKTNANKEVARKKRKAKGKK